jgi:hypothetical protein
MYRTCGWTPEVVSYNQKVLDSANNQMKRLEKDPKQQKGKWPSQYFDWSLVKSQAEDPVKL